MDFNLPSPVDTSISQRLKRERGQIIENFRKEFFNTGNLNDPLEIEKRRFTQRVVQWLTLDG
jgi:hypothetical protein